MRFSYKKLWIILIEKNMTKGDLAKMASITSATMAKMGKGLPVSMNVLGRICKALNVNIGDVVDFVGEEF